MAYGSFTISREELVEHLSSKSIILPGSIPIFFDDRLDNRIGFTDEKFDFVQGLVCHIEDDVFEKYARGNLDFRFGYKLNIDTTGERCIELSWINLVSAE